MLLRHFYKGKKNKKTRKKDVCVGLRDTECSPDSGTRRVDHGAGH